MIGRFLDDERGATAIEYALVAAGVAGVVVAAYYALGDTVQTTFYGKLTNSFQK